VTIPPGRGSALHGLRRSAPGAWWGPAVVRRPRAGPATMPGLSRPAGRWSSRHRRAAAGSYRTSRRRASPGCHM